MRDGTTTRPQSRALRPALRSALALGAGLVLAVAPSPGRNGTSALALVVVMGLFYAGVLLRLGHAVVRQPRRRAPLVVLAGSLCLWICGSGVLAIGGPLDQVVFPAPGEALFLLAYGGLAAFLLLDARRTGGRPVTIWIESAVVCGGAACLAGFVLVVPATLTSSRSDVPILLAYLYPTIALVLGLLVLSQLMLRERAASRRTAALGAGFIALAVAESSFVFTLASGTYAYSWPLTALYAVAFSLVVGAACVPEDVVAGPAPGRVSVGLLVGAAGVAVAVLLVRPAGDAGWYVVLPAFVTVTAVGARLVLALREAQGAAEARLLSRTDELTGLPNRRAILGELTQAIDERSSLALLLVDLDGFKEVNDSLGHAAGDAVLAVAARRLLALSSRTVMPGRLGGDEFAIVVRDDDHLRLVETAQMVRQALLEPVTIDSIELVNHASVGVAVHDGAEMTAAELLRRADVAMYDAKATRAGVLVYEVSRDAFSRNRLQLSEDLRKGIADGQLVVWYQPQVDTVTRRPVAVEALVRWEHPERGLLPPVAFLPDARRSGLMLALTERVMRTVVEDAARWRAEGFDFRVSFNCAPPELLGGVLLPRLFQAIQQAGLPPESLLVEVTEDSFLSDPEGAREALLELRAHDVQTAIDDYGTGFSSLAYLRDLPVQELKIDRSFVSTVLEDAPSRVIVDSTNRMATAMGLRLVAEGVEDEATALALAGMGVHAMQGYHFSRPVPAHEVTAWMHRSSALHEPVVAG